MDRIIIEGLQVESLIGVYDWERTAKTVLVVDVQIWVELERPGQSDQVADTLDYAKIAELIQQVASDSQFQLLEALAAAMIKHIFMQFNCHQIELKLSKPDILADARNVAVILTRKRS
ncbi:dihydroneopterin aldolase [Neptunicella sp. SCSIO 80796]|uniref:dihydroneopterin aldolase n=1 Tax=Neptunicella plasticusilytica TaxID=3117012 RepID=UPI003A4E39F4